jgi:hypothetical protein
MRQQLIVASGTDWDDSNALVCPLCDRADNHIISVASERSPDADEAPSPHDGTDMTVNPRNVGRRAALRINIKGECGHDWTLLLQQHKGRLYCYSRVDRES